MLNNAKQIQKYISYILIIIIFFVIVYQRNNIADSIGQIADANTSQIFFASLLTLYTFIASAVSYKILALKQLSFRELLIAQVAANFVNRLLPAGVGGIGANIQFLRHKKLSTYQAAATVTINNGLGIVGNLFIVILVIITNHPTLEKIHIQGKIIGMIIIVVGVIFIAVFINHRVRNVIKKSLIIFWNKIAVYHNHKIKLLIAILVQMTLTLATAGAFWFSLKAVGLGVTFAQAVIVFTIGFALGSALPTPAGIGGVEAGLLSGLLAYGFPSTAGLAGVILFRSINYWIPLLISAPVFWYASSQHYFSVKNQRHN